MMGHTVDVTVGEVVTNVWVVSVILSVVRKNYSRFRSQSTNFTRFKAKQRTANGFHQSLFRKKKFNSNAISALSIHGEPSTPNTAPPCSITKARCTTTTMTGYASLAFGVKLLVNKHFSNNNNHLNRTKWAVPLYSTVFEKKFFDRFRNRLIRFDHAESTSPIVFSNGTAVKPSLFHRLDRNLMPSHFLNSTLAANVRGLREHPAGEWEWAVHAGGVQARVFAASGLCVVHQWLRRCGERCAHDAGGNTGSTVSTHRYPQVTFLKGTASIVCCLSPEVCWKFIQKFNSQNIHKNREKKIHKNSIATV